MMEKHAQPMSPRTQAFSQMPSGDDEEKLFEEGLNQMAYNVLVSKFPDLIQQVITFKILDTDVDKGAGVGAFVLQHGSEIIYVPVVMADNQVKPLDLFYHKGLNVFLPLNNEWLDEVSQLTVDEMGEPVQRPKSLRRDMDTRNILIPPTTGRYAYAAAPQTDASITDDLMEMCRKLQTQEKTADETHGLVAFLHGAPNAIKEAFANVLQSRPKLAAQVTLMYGLDDVCDALRKTAADTTVDDEGELNVADRTTTSDDFKRIFGARAPEAFQGMLAKGYVAKDNRKGLNDAIQVQEPRDLITPDKSGFYRVFTTDGRILPAFVAVEPREILNRRPNNGPEGRNGKRHAGRAPTSFGNYSSEKRFLAITRGGTWVRCKALIAEPAWASSGYRPDKEHTDVFNKLLGQQQGDRPKVGDKGVFVVRTGQTFATTEPFGIKRVSTDSQGVRRIICDDYDNTVLVTDPNGPKNGLHQPKGEPLVYVPRDARFIRLKKYENDDDWGAPEGGAHARITLLSNPTDVSRWFTGKFDAMGAANVAVKNASAGQFSVDGAPAINKVAAMVEVARKYRIPFSAAENLVKQAEAKPNGRVTARVASPTDIAKIGMADPSMAGGAVPPSGDPAMGGAPPPGDPAAMGAAPPPPPAMPSPLDIAMGEAQTQMQQQASDLQMQQMALQDKSQTLSTVQQRAQEIAMGGAEAVQMGAPPMAMPGMGGPEGMPPEGAMPPGGAMPPQGAPQGPMPPGGGGMQAPAPDAAMPGGMGAVMQTESPSASEIQQQVNPQFLEQAAGLNDTQAFDAAAISSMAQSPSFRDMVVDYVPTLERALDNLGRIMLTLWMQEGELQQQLGDEDYSQLEDNIRAVFEGLGELVLQMNRQAIVMGTGE